MPERGVPSYVDVLDRVLDKGIVFDAWVRMSASGIDLIAAGTHVSVASVEIWDRYWPACGVFSLRRATSKRSQRAH